MNKPVKNTLSIAVVLLAGSAIVFPCLGQPYRINDTEMNHAQIALEMLQSGRYLVPTRHGIPYIDKPPLFDAVVALLYGAAGRVSLDLARLPSAVSAVLLVLAVYLLGRKWFNQRTALWSGLILATCFLVFEWARLSRADMMMSCLITYGLLFSVYAASARRRAVSWSFWLCATAAVTAATFCKGPVALFFFGVGVSAVWRAHRGRWAPPAAYVAVMLTAVGACFGAWEIAASQVHSDHVWHLLRHQFGPGLSLHQERFWIYAERIFVTTAPWSLFIPGAAWALLRRRKSAGFDEWAAPAFVVAVCLAAATLLPNRREHYLLPVLPLGALVVGSFLDRMVEANFTEGRGGCWKGTADPVWRRGFYWPMVLSLATLALSAAAGAVLLPLTAPCGGRAAVAGGVFCVLVAAMSLRGLLAARHDTTRATQALIAVMVVALAGAPWVTHLGYWTVPADFAAGKAIAKIMPPGAPVAADERGRSALFFALNRQCDFLLGEERLLAFLESGGTRYAIVPPHYLEVAGLFAGTIEELGRWQVRRKDTVVLLRADPDG